MKNNQTSGEPKRPQSGQKSLRADNLRSRREFLKRAAKKCAIPAIIVYSVHKMTPPAFGRTPI
jgi:hypothetical protein